MLEILQFIFSSFWVWLGALIFLLVLTGGMRKVVGFLIKTVKETDFNIPTKK